MLRFFLIILLLPLFSYANEDAGSFIVTRVSDNAVLSLDNNERVYLAGIVIPEKVNKEAVGLINKAYVGKAVKLTFGKRQQNRYGDLLAHVNAVSGEWLQGDLIKNGLALAYPTNDNLLMVNEMLSLEQEANDKKLGIWADANFGIRTADEVAGQLKKYRNKFEIVEGKVTQIKKARTGIYIDFGDDWRTDFTIGIVKENQNNFNGLEDLRRKKIRVRGWVQSYNGPFLEIYNGGQMQVF